MSGGGVGGNKLPEFKQWIDNEAILLRHEVLTVHTWQYKLYQNGEEKEVVIDVLNLQRLECWKIWHSGLPS
jgi:hypothetical protein